MLDFLARIWCVLSQIHLYLLYALTVSVNAVVSGLEAVAQAALDLLPGMATPENLAAAELPGGASIGTVFGWINYFIPVGTLITAFLTTGGAILGLWLLSIALRWVKAVE
jgi:hypothetical protein